MIPKYRCRRCGHEREDLAQMLAAVQSFHLVTDNAAAIAELRRIVKERRAA